MAIAHYTPYSCSRGQGLDIYGLLTHVHSFALDLLVVLSRQPTQPKCFRALTHGVGIFAQLSVFFFTVQRAIFGRTEPSRVYSLVCGVHSGCDSALSQSLIQVLPTTYCSSLILVLYTAISQNQRTRGPCWKAFPRWSNTRASYPVTRLEEWLDFRTIILLSHTLLITTNAGIFT
jgi:hypothetical protein